MELKDLVGIHELSGVDMSSEDTINKYGGKFRDCVAINFILDGITYTAIEDPEDGYRSSMSEIRQTSHVVNNTFEPQRVFCMMKAKPQREILECYDAYTGKIVLSVGTNWVDAWYPYFVYEFTPENMAINVSKEGDYRKTSK